MSWHSSNVPWRPNKLPHHKTPRGAHGKTCGSCSRDHLSGKIILSEDSAAKLKRSTQEAWAGCDSSQHKSKHENTFCEQLGTCSPPALQARNARRISYEPPQMIQEELEFRTMRAED